MVGIKGEGCSLKVHRVRLHEGKDDHDDDWGDDEEDEPNEIRNRVTLKTFHYLDSSSMASAKRLPSSRILRISKGWASSSTFMRWIS